MHDIVIIGGGPAGLTAATYACRAGRSVLVIEKNAFGGQITWSPKVENFPGFVSISGAELGDRLLEQAMSQGAEVELEEAVAVEREGELFRIRCESGASFEGRALILATGAKPRMLGVAHEEELVGSGVCYCAVCDGAFYAGKPVAVIGGGNSAMQEALQLSELASSVTIVQNLAYFTGEQRLAELIEKKENISAVFGALVERFTGEREIDARPLVIDLKPTSDGFDARLMLTERDSIKPELLIELLANMAGVQPPQARVHRLCLLGVDANGEPAPLMAL